MGNIQTLGVQLCVFGHCGNLKVISCLLNLKVIGDQMRKLYALVIVFLLLLSVFIYAYYSGYFTPKSSVPQPLGDFLYDYYNRAPGNTWIADSFDMLGLPYNRSRIIDWYNSKQCDDGSWYSQTRFYAAATAGILMIYNRSSVIPPKPLDRFFSRVDTWDKVNQEVSLYSAGNYWGGLWGYVEIYVVYKHEAPPWTDEFLSYANQTFESWVLNSHQRTHLIGNIAHLNAEIPRLNEVIDATLLTQKSDGSWDDNGNTQYSEVETALNIYLLLYFKTLNTQFRNQMDNAIQRGKDYIDSCYRTFTYGNKEYACFVSNSTIADPLTDTDSARATAQGIAAVKEPNGANVWNRWTLQKV